MRRFSILALALALMVGASVANAGEVKQKGEIRFTFGWWDNQDFNDNGSDDNAQEDDFLAEERVRHYIDYVSSETLKMTLGFEIDATWGSSFDRGADETNVYEVKRAQLAWVVPNTGLNMVWGVQGLALPGAVGGNPIYNDDAPGISASYKFNDMASLTAFWVRLEDDEYGSSNSEAKGDQQDDEEDLFGLVLPISMDGFSLAPYFAYAMIGNDVGDPDIDPGVSTTSSTTAFWLGTPFTMTVFDPLVFKADLQYGASSNDNDDASEAAGWRVDAALAYKMDIMTPTLIFNYGTGDDEDTANGHESMPYVRTSSNWGITSMATDGSFGSTATSTDHVLTYSGTSLMACGLAVEDIKLIDGLTNAVRLVYYKGTDDAKATNNFNEEDTAWEFNLDTKYQLYKNLLAGMEIAYLSIDADKDAGTRGGTDPYPDAASKAMFYLQYKF